MTESQHGLITVQELAIQAKVSKQYIRLVIRAGKIAGAYKLGDTWVIPKQAAERWLEQRQEG